MLESKKHCNRNKGYHWWVHLPTRHQQEQCQDAWRQKHLELKYNILFTKQNIQVLFHPTISKDTTYAYLEYKKGKNEETRQKK